jgi:prepilin-type N-terminal cleavage/methylation domain-containing protein
MKHEKTLNQLGFTLIEIIVTIALVSILCAAMLTFISDALIKSSDPIGRLKKTLDLHRVMANITQYYNIYPQWKISTSYCASGDDIVIPTNVNGYSYKCMMAGSSGASEPRWPMISGGVTDGTTSWVLCTNPPYPVCPSNNGRVHSLNSLLNLQSKIGPTGSDQANDCGSYYVKENKFIKFDTNGNEADDTSGTNQILKVTIRNNIGETLTALFMADYQS